MWVKIEQVTLPFLVLHGEADVVTDPEISKGLYEEASSKDKTIKLYPGMWHGLTSGETDENIEIVFADIIAWLDRHTGDAGFAALGPVHNYNYGIEKLTTSSSTAKVEKQELQQTESQGSNFCGLEGHHPLHSAM